MWGLACSAGYLTAAEGWSLGADGAAPSLASWPETWTPLARYSVLSSPSGRWSSRG